MTHHITDEQIFAVADEHADGGHGPVGEPANWYGFEQKSLLEFTRAALALAAPQGEPFGYFRATACGWEDCAEDDEGAIALYTAPAPAEGAMVDLKTAIAGVAEFFDGEYYRIKSVVPRKQASGDRQDDECHPFDHCLIDQDGGGVTGDDFHGTVYFHIGDSEYMAVEY